MGSPAFPNAPNSTTCDTCGDTVFLPPGVYYRGERLHKQCYIARRKEDVQDEAITPYLELVGEDYEKFFDNMGDISTEAAS